MPAIDQAQSLARPPAAAPTADPVHLYVPNFSGGGAERVFVRLANFLAASGVPTHFVVNQAIGPIKELVSPNVHIHVLGTPRAVTSFPRLIGFLRREKPRLVISALTRNNIVLVLARLLAGTDTRTVVSERNQFSAMAEKLSPMARAVLTWFVRFTYPRADGITAVASGVADDIAVVAGVSRRRVMVIHNPAPESEEIDMARAAPSPHPWLDDTVPTLVAIGRLVQQKDYATMLAAVAEANRSLPLRLIILGEGPLLDELKQRAIDLAIEDKVFFGGFAMNRFDYLVRADLFVLSSTTEGFPNALIEAIACGVPAVSTDCAGGGPKGILEDLYPEALTPVGDATAMSKAILQQLRTPKSSETIAQIAKGYSIAAVAQQFIAAGKP